MAQVNNLIKDLEKLNERYLELNPKNFKMPRNKKEVAERQEKLMRSGNLIIDFYKNTFLPKYSNIQGEIFEETSNLLSDLSYMVTDLSEKKNYFGLGALIIPKGSKFSDPNLLESFIKEAKTQQKA